MLRLDLKKIADVMNKVCDTGIDTSKVEGKELTGGEDGELHIVEKQNNQQKGEQK